MVEHGVLKIDGRTRSVRVVTLIHRQSPKEFLDVEHLLLQMVMNLVVESMEIRVEGRFDLFPANMKIVHVADIEASSISCKICVVDWSTYSC